LCFFKLRIMTKSKFKNQLWRHFSDVIAVTSPKNVSKITSQNFLFQFLAELESRPKSSRPRWDIDVPRLWTKSRDETETRYLKSHIYKISRIFLTFFFVLARCFTMLRVCHATPTQKLLCLHVFRQAGPPQRVDCLAPKWEIALSVFPKDTATCYRIGSRTKVAQPWLLARRSSNWSTPRRLLTFESDILGFT